MTFENNWKRLQNEYDYIQRHLANERDRVRQTPPRKIPKTGALTAARINNIKADVHAEETHNWSNNQ